MKRSDALALRLGLGIGVVGGFVLGYILVRLAPITHQGWVLISLTTLEGLVFAYLGPPDRKPLLPSYDVLEELAPGEFIEADDTSLGGGGPRPAGGAGGHQRARDHLRETNGREEPGVGF